jgi:uncharacterized protein YukE
MRNWIVLGVFSLVFCFCNSNIDSALVEEIENSEKNVDELISKLEETGENFAKFKGFVEKKTADLKTDTSAQFSAFLENYNEFSGRFAAVNSQLNDMKIRSVKMREDYEGAKVDEKAVRAEFQNFSASLNGISQTVDKFASDFENIQTDFAKTLSTLSLSKEDSESEE